MRKLGIALPASAHEKNGDPFTRKTKALALHLFHANAKLSRPGGLEPKAGARLAVDKSIAQKITLTPGSAGAPCWLGSGVRSEAWAVRMSYRSMDLR